MTLRKMGGALAIFKKFGLSSATKCSPDAALQETSIAHACEPSQDEVDKICALGLVPKPKIAKNLKNPKSIRTYDCRIRHTCPCLTILFDMKMYSRKNGIK